MPTPIKQPRKPPRSTYTDTPEWPVDRHSERIVLGHAIENWRYYKTRVGPDLFHEQSHQRILRAMLQLDEREEPIDKETISQELMREKSYEEGDISRLVELEGGFDPSTVAPYLSKLEKVCMLRQAAQHAQKITNEALISGADVRDIEKSAALLLKRLSEPRARDEAITEIPSPWGFEDSMNYLVEDLLMESGITMWSGESGDGKSTLALALAAAVAQGRPFLGRAAAPRMVLYLDRENPISVVKERLTRLGIPDISDRLKIWGLWWADHYPPGPDEASVLRFAQQAKPLLIFDSLIAFAGCDENSSTEMRSHMNNYRRLTALGATVLLIHHRSEKGDSQYRGSSDIRAAVDAAFGVSRDDESRAADPLGRLLLNPYKTRNHPGKPLRVEYRSGVFVPLDAPPKPAVDIVLSLVVCHPGATQKELVQLAEKQGLTYHRVLEALEVAILAQRIEVRVERRYNTRRHYLPQPRLEIAPATPPK
jgi:hypothetical protein